MARLVRRGRASNCARAPPWRASSPARCCSPTAPGWPPAPSSSASAPAPPPAGWPARLRRSTRGTARRWPTSGCAPPRRSVYAVGDCASFPSARYGARLLVHHWDNALQGAADGRREHAGRGRARTTRCRTSGPSSSAASCSTPATTPRTRCCGAATRRPRPGARAGCADGAAVGAARGRPAARPGPGPPADGGRRGGPTRPRPGRTPQVQAPGGGAGRADGGGFAPGRWMAGLVPVTEIDAKIDALVPAGSRSPNIADRLECPPAGSGSWSRKAS